MRRYLNTSVVFPKFQTRTWSAPDHCFWQALWMHCTEMHTSGTPPTPCKSLTTAESLCTHPAWRPKKRSLRHVSDSGNPTMVGIQLMTRVMFRPTMLFDQSYPMGHTEPVNNTDLFKLQITTFAENGKIQLTPEITNHLFICYLNCMCKSNPVCLIQQCSVVFLLASYVQWLYFLVWAYEN